MTCDCGFSEEVCRMNPCMRKKVHFAGLTPGSKWPNTGVLAEIQTEKPVSYRWRQPGNKHWIYDPTPEWIEDHRHEIELEPLYNAPSRSPAGSANELAQRLRGVATTLGLNGLANLAEPVDDAIDFLERLSQPDIAKKEGK